jgi:beta-phosphoglucomutase family hydrolase
VEWSAYEAVLFDLDGVLTPTATVHRRAWATMFDEFLAGRTEPQLPFTEDDYLAHVDGRPRFEGVRTFLRSRGIDLPEGDPDDPPEALTVHGLGNRKNSVFQAVLTSQGVEPYEGSVRLLDHLERLGIAMAVVSSSRNANDVLVAAGLRDRFVVVMDGELAGARGLAGKPAPDTFLAAAADLGHRPAATVVVEDALSGVAAGRAGGFGLVVGVDRGAGHDALVDTGADVVVGDLAETLKGTRAP